MLVKGGIRFHRLIYRSKPLISIMRMSPLGFNFKIQLALVDILPPNRYSLMKLKTHQSSLVKSLSITTIRSNHKSAHVRLYPKTLVCHLQWLRKILVVDISLLNSSILELDKLKSIVSSWGFFQVSLYLYFSQYHISWARTLIYWITICYWSIDLLFATIGLILSTCCKFGYDFNI